MPVGHGNHGHDLLAQHVKGMLRYLRGLDPARPHLPDRDRRGQQVGPMGREEHAFAHSVQTVSGAPEALQTGGAGGGTPDLDHQVDAAHVDPEFQTARCDNSRQTTGFERVLDDGPLRLADRAVVGTRDHRFRTPCGACHGHHLGGHRVVLGIVGRQFVEATGQPLADAPGVREHDGRGVLLDEPEDRRLHRGPDGCAPRPPVLGFVEGGHVGQGDGELEFGRFDRRGGDDAHVMTAVQVLRHRIDRSDRGGQADPLGRSLRQEIEARQRQAQVRSALRPGH